ncbi:MAG: hypothetical protein PVI30_17540 [Myxococcales bacterium]
MADFWMVSVVAVAVVLAGCGSDDGSDQAGGGQQAAFDVPAPVVPAGDGSAGSGGASTTPGGAASTTVDTGDTIDGTPQAGDAGVGDFGADPDASVTDDTTMMPPDGAGVPDGGLGDPSIDCPAPPAGATADAVAALDAMNRARLAAGSVCATLVNEIATAAQNHCDYYSMNDGMCVANPHLEVEGCAGFTGADPGARMQAAGYQSWGGGEVMAFEGNPAGSVQSWIDTVWHRIPVLDPWTTHMGYGGTADCDTIDFGSGEPAPDDVIVVYPYDGQTDVPLSFNGLYEGPMPPAPPTGWPSAYPVNVYAQDIAVTEHVITVDGDDTPIEHVWITPADSDLLRNGVFIYPYTPFEPNTTYRVRVTGTYVGGALALDWTFTTGEEQQFPWQ